MTDNDTATEFATYIDQFIRLSSGIKKCFNDGQDIDLLDLIALQFIIEELMDIIAESDGDE